MCTTRGRIDLFQLKLLTNYHRLCSQLARGSGHLSTIVRHHGWIFHKRHTQAQSAKKRIDLNMNFMLRHFSCSTVDYFKISRPWLRWNEPSKYRRQQEKTIRLANISETFVSQSLMAMNITSVDYTRPMFENFTSDLFPLAACSHWTIFYQGNWYWISNSLSSYAGQGFEIFPDWIPN